MAVMIGDNSFGEGKGDSKQSAEQVAAQNALENWQELVGKYFPANNA